MPDKSIDYKDVLFRVLDAVGDSEGTWFETNWDVPEETIRRIEEEYKQWKNETNIVT